MQVRWVVKSLRRGDTPVLPPAANPAMTPVPAFLALAGGVMTLTWGVLSNIKNIPTAAALIVAAAATAVRGGTIDNSPLTGLPFPLKEMHQTSHQAQVDTANTRKNKDAYNLAFARSTPMFDDYQGIQSQKDNATTQLTMMGYRSNVLKAVFCPYKN